MADGSFPWDDDGGQDIACEFVPYKMSFFQGRITTQSVICVYCGEVRRLDSETDGGV